MPSYTLLGARIPATGSAPESPPPPPPPAPKPGFRAATKFAALSITQKQTIGRLGTAAWKAEIAAGRITRPVKGLDAAAREWRHAQYHLVTGRHELEQCNQTHYRPLRAHFNAIIGTPEASASSYRDNVRTGPVKPEKCIEDTHEARELWRTNLHDALARYGYKIGYAAYIAGFKYKHPLGQCTAQDLYGLTCAVHGNARKTGRQPVNTSAPAAPASASEKPRPPRLTIIKPAPKSEPEAEGDPF